MFLILALIILAVFSKLNNSMILHNIFVEFQNLLSLYSQICEGQIIPALAQFGDQQIEFAMKHGRKNWTVEL